MIDQETLERHGRAYGELHLAITFTDGIDGEDAKRVTRKGWPQTKPLPDSDYGAGLVSGRAARHNLAVALGASGLIGIDVDGAEGAALLRRIHPELLPSTITVETGKGWHFLYHCPTSLSNVAKIELGPEGLEVARDGYFVAPPSRHPSGRTYRFAEGRAPWEIPLAVLTHKHLQPFLDHATCDRERSVASTGPIEAGGRHRHLRRIAGAMCRVGAHEEAILAALLVENQTRCSPPKDERLVRDLARDMHARYAPAHTGRHVEAA